MTIAHNKAAIEILASAIGQLQLIGFDCLLSPLSLPQGDSLSLHVSETIVGALAANVAIGRGAMSAHTAADAPGFDLDVAVALTEATILNAARVHPDG